MAAQDENALICDFAETYHIYDWRSLPARYAATLAAGLRPDARIMLKMSGLNASADTMLLATIADATRMLVWQKTRDARHGRNPPKSLVEMLTVKKNEANEPGEGFDSPEAFMAWREKMLRGEEYG